jgi:hypothetical protein
MSISKTLEAITFTSEESASGHSRGVHLDQLLGGIIQQVSDLRNHIGQLASHTTANTATVRNLINQL